MKKCTDCDQHKELSEFNRNRSRSDGYGSKCRECMKVYRKRHYQDNKNRIIRENMARKLAIREVIEQRLFEYLGEHSCVDCGNSDKRVLQFDHLPQFQKSANISDMIQNSWSWRNVLNEIQKCAVRCANCHSIKTQERGNHYRTRWE